MPCHSITSKGISLSQQKILILSKVACEFLCSFHRYNLNNLFFRNICECSSGGCNGVPSKIFLWINVDIRPNLRTRETFPVFFFSIKCTYESSPQKSRIQGSSWVDCAAWRKYFAKNAGKIQLMKHYIITLLLDSYLPFFSEVPGTPCFPCFNTCSQKPGLPNCKYVYCMYIVHINLVQNC